MWTIILRPPEPSGSMNIGERGGIPGKKLRDAIYYMDEFGVRDKDRISEFKHVINI